MRFYGNAVEALKVGGRQVSSNRYMPQEVMNIYKEKLKGREFDWFAIDTKGNIGMFSTAGRGFIPVSVQNDYQSHDLVSESIDSPNWGTASVWQDFSSLGLYVYDWELNEGPYTKVAIPSLPIPQSLKEKILGISSLIKLNINFSTVNEIKSL